MFNPTATTLYVAGPMRGLHLFNFPAFFAAAMKLRDWGYKVFNPAERDMAVGLDPSKPLDDPDNLAVFNLTKAFEWDFEAIRKADAIVLLPDWRESKGVQAELVLALALKREVFEWIDNSDLVPLNIPGYSVEFNQVKVEGVAR
ncbi:hypothetical protein LCGC14_1468680 [marine sediment metagenome]|uniref:DUF1937 domain-containing protein n=1 Tax=marine sediment metagenome TaxID=412755 RepID=A0A0F9JDK1_9ZZZZ